MGSRRTRPRVGQSLRPGLRPAHGAGSVPPRGVGQSRGLRGQPRGCGQPRHSSLRSRATPSQPVTRLGCGFQVRLVLNVLMLRRRIPSSKGWYCNGCPRGLRAETFQPRQRKLRTAQNPPRTKIQFTTSTKASQITVSIRRVWRILIGSHTH
jgi:hypothetical protein